MPTLPKISVPLPETHLFLTWPEPPHFFGTYRKDASPMSTYPAKVEVKILVRAFIYIHDLCVRVAPEARASLRILA